MAGTASAMFGCIQFLFAFGISQIIMIWPVRSTDPLGFTLALFGFLAFFALVMNYKKLAYVAKEA